MIYTKEDLNYYLREDSKRNGIKSYLNYLLQLFKNNENACVYQYIRCLRFCEFYKNNSNSIIYRIMYVIHKRKLNKLSIKYHIHIPLNVCGYGLRIMHINGGGGVLLNAKRIGNYCGFNSGVLLGNTDQIDNKPTIGHYSAFGPGAKAFGKISIGDNVFVAANSVVTKDIPNNCIVGGIPAKILKEK